MKVTIAGCRGSLPAPSGADLDGEEFKTSEFGGNTTCFLLTADSGKKMIVDAGTGIVKAGRHLMKHGFGSKADRELDIYITHTHWDHIQGFPFFVPAYIAGNKINMYGEMKVTGDLGDAVNRSDPPTQHFNGVLSLSGSGMYQVLAEQQNPRNFPAPLDYMKGLRRFYDFLPGATLGNGKDLVIETTGINHPGGCISYKFIEGAGESKKTTVIYTDFEHVGTPEEDRRVIDWWKGADLVVADG
ncbi:MAG: MBL fold metallo-hydrolase [archaeon]